MTEISAGTGTGRFPAGTDIPMELLEPLSDAEKEKDVIARKSQSYVKMVWGRLKKDKLAMFGLVVLFLMIVFAVFAPIFSPYDYAQTDFYHLLEWPSKEHWFGTDKMGRDIFIRTMYGARISLTIGFTAAFVNMIIGVLYGGIAGYFGGTADLIMMFLGNTMSSILLAMCLTFWITTARMVRGQILTLREQDFALAAKVCGLNKWQILIHHLIPNSIGTIIVTVTFLIPSAIFQEAFLSFLGIGIQVPQASWGTLANDAIEYLFTCPYQMFFPAAAISLTIFALNFIGDGLRDALDPRLKK